MDILLNDLSLSEFFLFLLVAISFFRLIIDLIKLFHPAQLFMKENAKKRK